MRVRSASAELEELLHRSVATIRQDLDELAIAFLLGEGGRYLEARGRLARRLRQSQTLANLLGRRRLVLEAKARRGPRAFDATPVIPRVPFEEAIADLVSRTPELARAAEDVRQLYSEGHGFGLARAAEDWVLEKTQEKLVGYLRDGSTTGQARRELVEVLRSQDPAALQRAGISPNGLTEAYAETVYRTNMALAYTDGRFEQVNDPTTRELLEGIVDGFRFEAVMDADTRANHAAADGMAAPFDHPVWQTLRPPLGFQCRCSVSLVSSDEITEAKTPDEAIAEGARPDEGFR